MTHLTTILLSSFALALGGAAHASTTAALFGEGGAVADTLQPELIIARGIGMPLAEGIKISAPEADFTPSPTASAPFSAPSSGDLLISTGTLEATLDSTLQETEGLSAAVLTFDLSDSALRADLARS